MLTAKSDISYKIEGLQYGADDYLTKPFNSKELLARVFKEEAGVKEFIKQFVDDIKNGKHDELLIYRKALRKE